MKKTRRPPLGTFTAAFVLSLCVLGLGVAFLLIECNLQQTVYGRVEPTLAFTLEAGVPTLTDSEGQVLTLLPDFWRHTAQAALGLPLRIGMWLLRCEQAVAAWLFEWLGGRMG